MPRIRQLPSSVVTKIAAGEVIERPASVVKELLENSVDAGSRRIDVAIEQGGVEIIRVVDDGCGIAPEDLPLAFASHATSKLKDADDLFRISTLGFRGEALASIGGVARVTLQSRPADRDHGGELCCNGGEFSPVKPWNGAPGTRIEVRHLFFNTPVRKKFLRTTATEVGHICETFTRLALAYPKLHLTLSHNNKSVYDVPSSAGLLDRIALFCGADVRQSLYAVEASVGPVRLSGYVADPACERGNSKLQYLFVNGRWVRDRSLMHALQDAFRGLLMVGRYAVAFLFLDLPPDQVDVNVHPTKSEVRFRDGQALYHLLRAAVRDRLTVANLVPTLQPPVANIDPPLAASPSEPTIFEASPAPASLDLRARVEELARPSVPWELPSLPPPASVSQTRTDSESAPKPVSPSTVPAHSKALQIHDAYLVVETPEGLLVIDQHALHERILFEQLKRRVKSGPLESQHLLIPEPVDLTAEQAARVLDARDALAELGLEVSDFGGNTVLLSAYPAMLGRRPPVEILLGVVDFLATKDRPPSREHLLNDLLSVMACRAAVKAGDRLTSEEVAALLEQRHLADDAHHCPHGRPTALLFSRQELDRQFRRI